MKRLSHWSCKWVGVSAVCALIGGCSPGTPDNAVFIIYREPMHFQLYDPENSSDPNPGQNLGYVAYYSISCIVNKGADASPFTFDVTRVSVVPATPPPMTITAGQSHLGTAKISIPVATAPFNVPWTSSALSADQALASAHIAYQPPQPYAFVMADFTDPWNMNDPANVGTARPLTYNAPSGQPVNMVPEALPGPQGGALPPPVWKWSAAHSDLMRGYYQGPPWPAFPPPSCQ